MLRLYQSNRLEILAQRLAERVAEPGGGLPLQADTIVVQHPGMARWLSLKIAEHTGLCANIRFPQPGALFWEILNVFLPDIPPSNGFSPQRLKWPIFEQLGQLDEQPLFLPVRRYLRQDDEQRRMQLAEKLADLYDRYLMYRPDWIIRWETGQSAVKGDEWQAELWRRLTSVQTNHWVGLQRRIYAYTGDPPAGLPDRLFLIGMPTLSSGYLQLVHWLAQWAEIHLFLLNPCETHWAEIVDARELARRELAQSGMQLYLDLGNPLLASLGRQGRDFFAAVNELDPGSEEWFVDPGDTTLLHRLQSEILSLHKPEPVTEPCEDQSIGFHLYHSPMREIEGLYDRLLDMLDRLEGLLPDDILVMTPDVETYAPLVEAVFDTPGDRPVIPYRIADQTPLSANRNIAVFLELLEMPGSRFSVNRLLGLLEIPAIQQRFGLDESAMDQLTDWIDAAHVRWGRDGASKVSLGLPEEPRNTWRAGLQQLLLGFAMPAESADLWRGIAPLDAAEGANSAWLGGLVSFCETVFALEELLARPRDLRRWRDSLLRVIEDFFAPDLDTEHDLQQLRNGIQQLQDDAEVAGFSSEVSLPLVREQLQQIFSRPTSRGFLGGGVNFCSLAPMRSLPFRVICLIGMNEGSFPRQESQLGFDLMNRGFRFGDRSRRADDRYLFLETLISARDRLYLSYVGRSSRDNSVLPPSVLVDELRDYLGVLIGEEGLTGLTQIHPLQPFSPAYFKPGGEPFSYSPRLRELASMVGQGKGQRRPLLSQPLVAAQTDEEPINLKQLMDFFTNPARVFARQRLNLQLETGGTLLEEREVFQLEKFTREDLEHDLVDALLEGRSGDEIFDRLDARGELPHGRLGRQTFQQLLDSAQQMQTRLVGLDPGRRLPPLDFQMDLADCRLVGRLTDLYSSGQLDYTLGGFHPYRKLNLWIRHLVLNQLEPAGVEPVSVWLERQGEGRFGSMEEAQHYLTQLIELYRQGLRGPLHFYPGSSWAYAESLLNKGDLGQAASAARKRWVGNDFLAGDMEKPYHRLLLPGDDILDDAFCKLSLQIFQPLIEHLETAS